MKFIVQEVVYRPNQDRVTVVTAHAFGLTNVDTTETALQARAPKGAQWGDEQVRAEAEAVLAARFPTETPVAELAAAPAPLSETVLATPPSPQVL